MYFKKVQKCIEIPSSPLPFLQCREYRGDRQKKNQVQTQMMHMETTSFKMITKLGEELRALLKKLINNCTGLNMFYLLSFYTFFNFFYLLSFIFFIFSLYTVFISTFRLCQSALIGWTLPPACLQLACGLPVACLPLYSSGSSPLYWFRALCKSFENFVRSTQS